VRRIRSGTGTNLKVEGTIFFVVPIHLFGSTSTISRFVFDERFRDGKYSLVSVLFAVLLLTYLLQTGSYDESIHPRHLSVPPTVMFHLRF